MGAFLRGTETERRRIRATVYSGAAEIRIHEDRDGVWFADLGHAVIEAESAAELLRELARILEEV